MGPPIVGGSPAPVDCPILEFLRSRLAATEQVERATITAEGGHLELRVGLTESYYPAVVSGATLAVRWYENDDFSIHYREARADRDWECHWDRHPNPHTDRDHFHPPPPAATLAEDATWPTDYRDVVALVLDEIEARIDDIWDE